jgi:predicted enzyme related to lactoylglutathione lyase
MITGIMATVFVADMDRAVSFYTKLLELPLAGRWGNEFATIDMGRGMALGLHPSHGGRPVTTGENTVQIGLSVNVPLEQAVRTLAARGVHFSQPIVDDKQVRLAHFHDPDGNELYLSEVRKWS